MGSSKDVCSGGVRESYIVDYRDVRRGLLDFNPSTTGREAFLAWIKKYKRRVYEEAVEKALKAYVTDTWAHQNREIIQDVAEALGKVFQESYANIRVDIGGEEVFEKDVLDPTVDINLVWWYYWFNGIGLSGCSNTGLNYETINGAQSTLWYVGTVWEGGWVYDIDITNSGYLLTPSISSNVDQALNTNVMGLPQQCGYNNSNGYGLSNMKGNSGSITLVSNTIMLQNSWTTPSSVSSLTLDTVAFEVGYTCLSACNTVCTQLCGAESYTPSGEVCSGGCCSGLSGNYNPGFCQGYPILPIFYGKLSSPVTVGASQSITYYMYLI